MKSLAAAISVILVAVGACLRLSATAGEPDAAVKRPKWEYKVIGSFEVFAAAEQHGKDKSLENGLNALGDDGWELVAFTPDVPDPVRLNDSKLSSRERLINLSPTVYYFKRQRQ